MPPRHGDKVYCLGVVAGLVYGRPPEDGSPSGEWCIEIVRSRDLPPELAARFRGDQS